MKRQTSRISNKSSSVSTCRVSLTQHLQPESYLGALSKFGNSKDVQIFIKRSADHHYYDWDYLSELVRPLEFNLLPQKNLNELNFAVGNLLIDLEEEHFQYSFLRLYLASIYLYVNQVQPVGSALQATAVRFALENLVNRNDQELLNLFLEYLAWLLSPNIACNDSEDFFIRLGILVGRTHLSLAHPSEYTSIKTYIPAWVAGVKDIKLLCSDPKFPASWVPLLKKVNLGKKIKPLLGLK